MHLALGDPLDGRSKWKVLVLYSQDSFAFDAALAGLGKCAFALRDLPAGEMILEENPTNWTSKWLSFTKTSRNKIARSVSYPAS